MPCCAFVACLIGQLLVAFGAVKRLFGAPAGDGRNAAVEWRLDAAPAPFDAREREPWLWPSRFGRGLALVAGLEILLLVGAVWGLREHLGHGDHAPHAAHASHAADPRLVGE